MRMRIYIQICENIDKLTTQLLHIAQDHNCTKHRRNFVCDGGDSQHHFFPRAICTQLEYLAVYCRASSKIRPVVDRKCHAPFFEQRIFIFQINKLVMGSF